MPVGVGLQPIILLGGLIIADRSTVAVVGR